MSIVKFIGFLVYMSLVISRTDYCNSVLVGLAASTLAPLQRVQNAAARLILGLSRPSHSTPALKQLHWLPIKFRITFKVATLMYNIFHQRSPPYLKDPGSVLCILDTITFYVCMCVCVYRSISKDTTVTTCNFCHPHHCLCYKFSTINCLT